MTTTRIDQVDRLIDDGRREIDSLDRRIREMISQRCATASSVQAIRIQSGRPRVELTRESRVIADYTEALGRAGAEMALALLQLSRGNEAPLLGTGPHAYLGPAGTFTEAALDTVVQSSAERTAMPSITEALDAVRRGTAVDATVPWENSIAGTVEETVRGMAIGEPLTIRREILMPIELVLAAPSATTLRGVRRIISHPHAMAQSERWLAAQVPAGRRLAMASTAKAAEAVARGGSAGDAVVCSLQAARAHGLAVLARPPRGVIPAITRFVMVTRARPPAPVAAGQLTSLLLHLPSGFDPDGITERFAATGTGPLRTDHRPVTLPTGTVCLGVHVPCHFGEPALQPVLAELRRAGVDIRFLGTYAAGSPAPLPAAG